MSSLLVIDDNRTLASGIARNLRGAGHEVETAGSVEDGIAMLRSFRYDMVACDLRLDDGTAADVLDAMSTHPYRTPVLLMSAAPDDSLAELASQHDWILGVLLKPFATAALLRFVDRAGAARL